MGSPPPNRSFKEQIRDRAQELGFPLCGFTTPESPPHLSVFRAWLEKGRQGGMAYLGTRRARMARAQPRILLAGCQSVIVLAAPYPVPNPRPPAPLGGRVASYALGEDYHDVLLPKLKALAGWIEQRAESPIRFRAYTDTGPILERDLAQRAGLGWIGKNTLLIHPRYGSYFFLAEILTDLRLAPDDPFRADRCGSCTRCLQACPTRCILPDRTLQAGRCVSYLTIELRGAVPVELREALGNWVFGCDICQEVCPWNRRADPPPPDPRFLPRAHLPPADLSQELSGDKRETALRFRGSALRRTRSEGYRRNLALALGNSRQAAAIPALQQALRDPQALLRQHAAWALGRISSPEAREALRRALPEEPDPVCRREVLQALGERPPETGEGDPP